MQLGYIGLGKMGKNMVERLLTKNHNIVVWNRSGEVAKEMEMLGAIAAESIEELVLALSTPRSIWLMLPAGEPTHSMIEHLSRLLASGDTLINGANEFYKDTKSQAEMLYKKGVNLLDAGVSGGPGGAKNGACVMIGGRKEIFSKHEQLFADISAPNAYQFFEGAGAGHFVKMVHNGIEYGMMQAIAEGFDVLKKSDYNLNLSDVATIYANRSVIESRLVSWLLSGLMEYGQTLEHISGSAGSGGAAGMNQSEAKWTLDAASELGVYAPAIMAAVEVRVESQQNPSFQGKIINTLRNQFGGHEVKQKA